ncbi:MAG: carboxypeptidase-like regulatory domain-containing protein, partial [Actinobacteria bacterium]|nr:carboxypeptidase-like regulatory domain-containing protein [Actinomycetota bacterium]
MSTVLTDDTGHYEIDVARGDRLWATDPRWLDSPRCYVSSLLSAERTEVDLHLAPTRGRASILVVDADGAPVPEARLLFDPFRRTAQTVRAGGTLEFPAPAPTLVTDSDGRTEFLFPDRPRLDVAVVSADQPGWAGDIDAPRTGETLTIQLPAPLGIAGTCRYWNGELAPGATVAAQQLGGLFRREVRAGADGSFRLEGLAEGEYVLRAAEDPTLGAASVWYRGSVGAGPASNVELVLDLRHSISGVVVDRDGPASGVAVELMSVNTHVSEDALRTTRTDERGRFSFPGAGAAARHMVRAQSQRGPGASIEIRPGNQDVVLVLDEEAAEAPVVL